MIYDSDAELYDLQYAGYRDDVPFYLRLADELGGPVLELGAGTGRLTEALAGAGHEVVGVELAPAMLARASGRLARHIATGRVTLHAGDMRDFALETAFPLVIAPFNALMHAYTVADQDRVLASVRRHLAPGGTFAFDVYQPRLGPLGVVRREREWQELSGPGSELLLVQYHDPDAQLVESVYHLDQVGADGVLRRRSARLLQRYFTRFELERACSQAGFERLRLFGGFENQRLTHESPLVVGIAG